MKKFIAITALALTIASTSYTADGDHKSHHPAR